MSNLALIPSIFLFFGMISIIYAVAIYYFLKVRDQQAVRYWSFGSLIWGCAILLTIWRQELPLLLSYFIANGVAFVAYVVLNRALKCLIEEVQESFKLGLIDLGIFAVFTCVLYAIDLGMPGEFRELAKTGFVSAMVVAVSIQGARYCYLISVRHGLMIAQNFAYLYVAVAFLWASRVVAAAVVQATHAFDPGLINSVIWVAVFITGVVKYMVFPMLLLKKTENEKVEHFRKSLARANKTVTSSALSASIAHELNQPLAAIRINSQILLKALEEQRDGLSGHDSLEMKSIVTDILKDNERASKIILTLRSIFRHAPASDQSVDSARLIRKNLELLTKEIDKRQPQIGLNLVEDVFIKIPEDEFHQVLVNLIFNSLEALSDLPVLQERKLLIQSAYRQGMLEVTVLDNGPGINPEMEDSLFEILSTSKDSGMGLGLWLCKYIVERHGGTITYQPSILGGASFRIALPCHTIYAGDSAAGLSSKLDHPIV